MWKIMWKMLIKSSLTTNTAGLTELLRLTKADQILNEFYFVPRWAKNFCVQDIINLI